MKPFLTLLSVVVFTSIAAPPLAAEVQVRMSFKVILGPNDEFPDNAGGIINPTGVNLNSEAAIRNNIAFINAMLTRRGESFRLFLRDDTVFTVAGQSDPWFSMDARNGGNRSNLESTATASASARTTWRWHDDSINVYLNDSSSGICAFPGFGNAILIGAGAYQELLIHEIGHYLSLPHTHPGDSDGNIDDWGDGDGFSETLNDDPDATASDINQRYDGNPEPMHPQSVRDDLIFNIMSYHLPQDRFVWQQRQAMVETYNNSRDFQASGKGRFVRSDGSDFLNDGETFGARLQTLERAVELSTSANDVMLLDGQQEVANGTVFTKPMTWLKWRNNAVIQ